MKQSGKMILSSADILRVLGGDPIIRQEARLSIVDDRPGIGLDEYVYIYVQRYPAVDEFEATWKIWVQDGGSDVLDLVLAAMTRLLPNFDYHKKYYSTTDFKTADTVVEPGPEEQFTAKDEIDARFKLLSDELLKRVNQLKDGIDGIDGLDGLPGAPGSPGRDGKDGRDGRDLDATEVELFDLKDTEQGILLERGQVLTWDGEKWTNLYIPRQVTSITGGGSGGGNVGSGENCDVHDGGDFDTGVAIAPSCSGLTSTVLVDTSSYQVLVSDFYIGVNYDGNVTITMPAGQNNGLKYVVKDERGEAGNPSHYITIQGLNSDLVDSESSVVIGYNYGSLTLIWRDNAWRIV